MMKISAALRDAVTSLIGEGVHTGLRKFADSPESAVAWNAIDKMPDAEWTSICRITAGVVIEAVRRHDREKKNG